MMFRLIAFLLLTVSGATAAPLVLDFRTHVLGGNVAGAGVLADYPAGGPGLVTLTRETRPGANQLKPDYGAWGAVASFRIFDPAGKLVKFVDLGTQTETKKTYRIQLPEGKAGIWRFSVANGIAGDRYRLELPESPAWGIRGEMALGVMPGFPETWHLFVPKTAKMLVVEKFGKGNGAITVSHRDNRLGETAKRGSRTLLQLNNPPRGEVVAIQLQRMSGDALAIDGAPGLLCPTPEMAAKLKGGLIEHRDFYLGGPLQAEARKIAEAIATTQLKVEAAPIALPAGKIENPRLECLPFSKYGNIPTLAAAVANQTVDPASPYLGANVMPEKRAAQPDPREFIYPSVWSPFSAASIASIVAFPGKFNPVRDNPALVQRAVLAAFYHLAMLQGDDILREGDFRTNNYPMTHAFFVYEGLSKAYGLLQDRLPPETRRVWRELMINMGDKMATCMAYESNQWLHVILGHLNVYQATGETRFKDYFELFTNNFADGSFGPNSKHGQHPAGYFLEEYGPDGNYDHVGFFPFVTAYYRYRELPGARPELVAKMKKAIEKNLYFASFYWMVQPDGELMCPTAINCRTPAALTHPGYPGVYMAAREFDLARTRQLMAPVPAKGTFPASVFSHFATTDAWAERLIRTEAPAGIAKSASFDYAGSWLMDIYDAFKLPEKARRTTIPPEAESGLWELPGQIAWKQGDLYGLIFYDVAGANPKQDLNGITSGGPTALYSKELGTPLMSMRNNARNRMASPDDMTWAGVSGTIGGKPAATGKERNKLTWITPGKRFAIEGTLREADGTIRWEYEFAPNKIELTVRLNAPKLENPVLNLPFVRTAASGTLVAPKDGKFHYLLGDYFLRVRFPAETAATLTGPLTSSHAQWPVQVLRLPFPANRELKLSIDIGKY